MLLISRQWRGSGKTGIPRNTGKKMLDCVGKCSLAVKSRVQKNSFIQNIKESLAILGIPDNPLMKY